MEKDHVGWVRYDPDDESTLPPEKGDVLDATPFSQNGVTTWHYRILSASTMRSLVLGVPTAEWWWRLLPEPPYME